MFGVNVGAPILDVVPGTRGLILQALCHSMGHLSGRAIARQGRSGGVNNVWGARRSGPERDRVARTVCEQSWQSAQPRAPAAQPCTARAGGGDHAALPRARRRQDADLFRGAGLLRDPAQGLHERPGVGISRDRARRHGHALSRGAHVRSLGTYAEAEVFIRETKGLDARFYSGHADVSELPSAYKPAATVRAQMAHYGLAEVVDEIHPYGCIMAGDWARGAAWRLKAVAKYAAAHQGAA